MRKSGKEMGNFCAIISAQTIDNQPNLGKFIFSCAPPHSTHSAWSTNQQKTPLISPYPNFEGIYNQLSLFVHLLL
jgi:hypothetical protein